MTFSDGSSEADYSRRIIQHERHALTLENRGWQLLAPNSIADGRARRIGYDCCLSRSGIKGSHRMPTLPPSAEKVAQAADAIGLAINIHVMAQSTRTAVQAADACGCSVGQIVKSLIFRVGPSGRPILLLVSGTNRVNEAKIADLVGGKIERPDADYVRNATGFAIGGIPPFGHTMPLETWLDEALLQHDVVWAAAGTPLAVFAVEPKKLQQATNARIVSVI
jgi:prolyl-tRNA editing enzyme YbaK/EbsC (Cys-tRNA(Pro) deacylase)